MLFFRKEKSSIQFIISETCASSDGVNPAFLILFLVSIKSCHRELEDHACFFHPAKGKHGPGNRAISLTFQCLAMDSSKALDNRTGYVLPLSSCVIHYVLIIQRVYFPLHHDYFFILMSHVFHSPWSLLASSNKEKAKTSFKGGHSPLPRAHLASIPLPQLPNHPAQHFFLFLFSPLGHSVFWKQIY